MTTQGDSLVTFEEFEKTELHGEDGSDSTSDTSEILDKESMQLELSEELLSIEAGDLESVEDKLSEELGVRESEEQRDRMVELPLLSCCCMMSEYRDKITQSVW